MNFSGKKFKHRKITKNIIAHLGSAVASLGDVLAILEAALAPLAPPPDFMEVPRGVLAVHETLEVSFDTIATSLASPVTPRPDPLASCKSLLSAVVMTASADPSDSNIPSEAEKPVSQGTQIVSPAIF
jgi:hypothetical protein